MTAPQALIFDLDGTLWDSCATVAKAWTQGALEMGHPELSLSPETVQTTMGLTFDEIFEKLWPHLNLHDRRLIGHHCETVETALLLQEPGTLFEGVKQGLLELSEHYRLMIVSNCQTGYIENFLHHSGLEDIFEDWECFGDTHRPKCENIQLVMQRCQLESAWYFGDTLKDESSSRTAQLPFGFVEWGFGQCENPDLRFLNFEALVQHFIQIKQKSPV